MIMGPQNEEVIKKIALPILLTAVIIAISIKTGIADSLNGRAEHPIQVINVPSDGLRDLVIHERIKNVFLSAPNDFKLEKEMVGPESHLIVESLKKDAGSDLVIVGFTHVHYLRLETVPRSGMVYSIRKEIQEGK